MIHSRTHDISPLGSRRNSAVCPLGVGRCLGVVTQEKERNIKHAVRRRKSDRIGKTFGNRLGLATESERTLEVFKARTKTSQTGEGSQLIVGIVKNFGKLASPRHPCTCSPARALIEPQREAKRSLQHHLPARPPIRGINT